MAVMRSSCVVALLIKHSVNSLTRHCHNQPKIRLITRTTLIYNPLLALEVPGFDKESWVKSPIKPILSLKSHQEKSFNSRRNHDPASSIFARPGPWREPNPAAHTGDAVYQV